MALWFAIMKSQKGGPPGAILEHKADEILENIKEHLKIELNKIAKTSLTSSEVFDCLEKAYYNYILDFKKESIYVD